MKKPKRQDAPNGIPSTVEEIRQRAHEIFLARGGEPGKELEDWLRAESELKHERAAVDSGTSQ